MTQHHVMERLVRDYVPKNGVGCEIGVWKGEGSAKLLEAAQPFKMFLIDPWIPIPEDHIEKYTSACWRDYDYETHTKFYLHVLKQFAIQRKEKRVEVIRAKSEDAVTLFDDEFFDWVFVDGDHSYEAVLNDLQLYSKKLKVGGFLMGDDYYGSDWCYQVGLAVDDFMKDNSWMEWVKQDGEQYLLRKLANEPEPDRPSQL